MYANLRSILRASTLVTATLALSALTGTAAMAAPGNGESADIDVTHTCTTVDITSTKDLSNVVLLFTDGTKQRFEGLSSETGSFRGTGGNADAVISTVWVKSGNNKSGDGPGYGERFAFSTEECDEPQDQPGDTTGEDSTDDDTTNPPSGDQGGDADDTNVNDTPKGDATPATEPTEQSNDDDTNDDTTPKGDDTPATGPTEQSNDGDTNDEDTSTQDDTTDETAPTPLVIADPIYPTDDTTTTDESTEDTAPNGEATEGDDAETTTDDTAEGSAPQGEGTEGTSDEVGDARLEDTDTASDGQVFGPDLTTSVLNATLTNGLVAAGDEAGQAAPTVASGTLPRAGGDSTTIITLALLALALGASALGFTRRAA